MWLCNKHRLLLALSRGGTDGLQVSRHGLCADIDVVLVHQGGAEMTQWDTFSLFVVRLSRFAQSASTHQFSSSTMVVGVLRLHVAMISHRAGTMGTVALHGDDRVAPATSLCKASTQRGR
jgi:hypothetical protein